MVDFATQNLHFKLKSNRFYGIMKKNKAKEHEWDGTLC